MNKLLILSAFLLLALLILLVYCGIPTEQVEQPTPIKNKVTWTQEIIENNQTITPQYYQIDKPEYKPDINPSEINIIEADLPDINFDTQKSQTELRGF